MPTTEARIPTDRAGRYLTQLCEHTARISGNTLGHRSHHSAGTLPRSAEHSDAHGVIEFEGGRCTLTAAADELILLAEAGDQHELERIQNALSERLRKIGRRDNLRLTWRST